MKSFPPRLLFLAFPFPPSRAIAAVRCAKLTKYLSKLGWQITVVTIDPGLLADVDPGIPDVAAWCRELGVQRVLTGHDYRMLYGGALVGRWWERPALVRKVGRRVARWVGMDPGVGWNRPVLDACAKFQPGDFDVVLASGSPFPAFEAACQLGRRLGAKVVMDYRDLWSQAPHARYRVPAWVLRTERELLQQATGVFVVSSGMVRCMEREFGHADKLSVITNGFDPDEYGDIVATSFLQPTVVYAGNFYPPLRIIHPVLNAIGRANQNGLPGGKRIKLLYLGADSAHVLEAARKNNVVRWVDVGGCVRRREVLAALKGAMAAVVITSVAKDATPAVDTILTGKLFEAMGAGARVLLVAPPGTEAERVVVQTHAGRSFVGSDIEGMSNWLSQLACGVEPNPVSDVQAYAWPEIARKADRVLRGLLK